MLCRAIKSTGKPRSSCKMAHHNLPWHHTKGPVTLTQPDMTANNKPLKHWFTSIWVMYLFAKKTQLKRDYLFPGLSATSHSLPQQIVCSVVMAISQFPIMWSKYGTMELLSCHGSSSVVLKFHNDDNCDISTTTGQAPSTDEAHEMKLKALGGKKLESGPWVTILCQTTVFQGQQIPLKAPLWIQWFEFHNDCLPQACGEIMRLVVCVRVGMCPSICPWQVSHSTVLVFLPLIYECMRKDPHGCGDSQLLQQQKAFLAIGLTKTKPWDIVSQFLKSFFLDKWELIRAECKPAHLLAHIICISLADNIQCS